MARNIPRRDKLDDEVDALIAKAVAMPPDAAMQAYDRALAYDRESPWYDLDTDYDTDDEDEPPADTTAIAEVGG